jgi:4-aminobutyrate aminotransferase
VTSAASHTSNVWAKTTDLQVVRGRGLMVATEFDTPERAEAVVAHCLREHRLIRILAGTRNRTIRWMPPLVVTSDEVTEATHAFAAAIRATG